MAVTKIAEQIAAHRYITLLTTQAATRATPSSSWSHQAALQTGAKAATKVALLRANSPRTKTTQNAIAQANQATPTPMHPKLSHCRRQMATAVASNARTAIT